MTADITAEELQIGADMEMIVLPGGMPGTLNEEASETVQAAIDYCAKNDRWIGAICAAPSILGHKGLLQGKTATCYTGFEKDLLGAEIGSDGVILKGYDKVKPEKNAGEILISGDGFMKIIVSPAKKMRAADDWMAAETVPVYINEAETLLKKVKILHGAGA